MLEQKVRQVLCYRDKGSVVINTTLDMSYCQNLSCKNKIALSKVQCDLDLRTTLEHKVKQVLCYRHKGSVVVSAMFL